MARRRPHPDLQMLASNTSWQGFPITSSRRIPVICSAALLKNETRQSASTVKTPSATQSRTAVARSESIAVLFESSAPIQPPSSSSHVSTWSYSDTTRDPSGPAPLGTPGRVERDPTMGTAVPRPRSTTPAGVRGPLPTERAARECRFAGQALRSDEDLLKCQAVTRTEPPARRNGICGTEIEAQSCVELYTSTAIMVSRTSARTTTTTVLASVRTRTAGPGSGKSGYAVSPFSHPPGQSNL